MVKCFVIRDGLEMRATRRVLKDTMEEIAMKNVHIAKMENHVTISQERASPVVEYVMMVMKVGNVTKNVRLDFSELRAVTFAIVLMEQIVIT